MITKNVEVVILVSQKYALAPHNDDLTLKEALEERGYMTDIVAWDDTTYDFNTIKLAIIRSCWDYDDRVSEFFDAMKKISESTILINDYKTILNNSNKYYLEGLNDKGISIIPTYYISKLDDVETAVKGIDAEKIIIKPVISASGKNTFRVKRQDINEIRRLVDEILKEKHAMLQPYIETIESKGEKSTIVVDGKIVYAVDKKPAKGGYLVHNHMGGSYNESDITSLDIRFIDGIIRTMEKTPTYMRVDYLFDEAGEPMLLELELIEPNLYLSKSKKSLDILVDSMVKILKSN
ncbi:hypothetical protein PV797_01220 [Clostridiaceae bacterium M8S5]|nr:hypothetical protein PV797_01220 [Clostridiaceae bacterium M8S5]